MRERNECEDCDPGDQQQAADSKRTVVDSRMEQQTKAAKKAIKGGGKGVAASELGAVSKGRERKEKNGEWRWTRPSQE